MKYHVLHLIGSNLVGGPEKQILHHAEDMQGSDYEIEIGSFHDLSDRPEILAAAEQRHIPTLCLKGGLHWDMVHELAQQLRERKGHLLCTHGFKANVVGYLAARRTNTLHIPCLRGWTAETWRVIVYEMLERQVLRRAPIVMCVSAKQAEQIAKMRGNRRKPVVIPNAMLPPYSRKTGEAAVSRQQLGIPEEAFVFGSVGRLSAEKGHRFMISAFHEACAAPGLQQPLRLIVIGDGREQEALENQASELGVGDKVHFAGYQGNCDEWMRLFDCMVQPSLTEGTPNSVLEALCLQVPVVATAVGGVPDLIVDRQNGLLVPAGDSHALAVGMLELVRSPELKAKLIGGASTVKEQYAPETQRQRFVSVYQMAFGSPPPASQEPLPATLKA
jgi:glycosyltransferase involved in cell wall biosynthesis